MVLSSKQVSGDGIDWGQTLLQRGGSLELHKPPPPPPPRRQQTPPSSQSQLEPLKCPRCDSTNTKFCYFNNYNKSQPRHFCKSCKRHWTKGGTLRNVPVGGGRKNKRPKTASATAAAAVSSAATGTTGRNIIKMGIQPPPQQPRKSGGLALGGDHHEKSSSSLSGILYRALIRPPPPQQQQQNSTTGGGSTGMMSMASIPSISPNHFPFVDPSCSITSTLQASNAYNNYEEAKAEVSTMAGTGTTGGSMMMSSQQPWQVVMDSTANYWSWDDIDTLVSSDLNIPWDDSEIKP